MNNKDLKDILENYAEATRNKREVAFKKLNEQPKPAKRTNKRFKPQYCFAVALSAIVIVLCIALPITLTSNPTPGGSASKYCSNEDIMFNMEDNISILINNLNIKALYPTYDISSVSSISSYSDVDFHGALLSFIIEENGLTFTDIAIIPNTYVLQMYEDYYKLNNEQIWSNYNLKYIIEYNEFADMFDMKVYFTDGEYDYFITVNSDYEVNPVELFNILYS